MKRIVYIFFSLLLSLSASEKVTFKTTDFAPAPDSAFSIEGKAYLAVYHAFRKKYPNIIPESNPMGLKFEGAAGEAPLLMSIAGETAPDVFAVNGRQSGSFVQREFLTPLDDFINIELTAAEAKEQGIFDADVMYQEEWNERVKDQAKDAVHRVGPDGKKHFYFMPYSYWARALAYSKNLFLENGLDPENGYPKTWDEMLSTAKKLHKPKNNSYGMLVDTSGGASWVALPLFYANGSKFIERNSESGEWRATFNDPGAVEAADFYLQLVDGAWKNNEGEEFFGVGRTEAAWPLWNKGRIGMVFLYINDLLINADTNLSALNPEELGIVPIPKAPSGKQTTELHVRGLGICATTPKEKVLATWRFIRFVGSPEAQKEIVRVYIENGYGSYINPEKLKEFGYTEYLHTVPTQWANTLKTSLEDSYPEPYGKNCQVFILRASKPLEAALTSEIPRIQDKEVRLEKLQILYDQAVEETNEKMLGYVPEETMNFRRKVALAVIITIAISFIAMFIYIWRIFTPPKNEYAAKTKWTKNLPAYLLLTPAIATIAIFNYYPLIYGSYMAFLDYNVIAGAAGSKFVGVDNFAAILFDSTFWISMLRTFEYVFWSLILVFLSPIALALVLSEIPQGKILFRIVYYLPAVVSGLVVMLMWKMFFEPSSSGMFNQVLDIIGIGPQKWLQDSSLAMISILLPVAWAGIGPGSLIYLAALKTVPEDLYEATAIDGAGFFKRIWYVTIPTIRPLVLIQLIFVLIGAFQSADNVLVMTGGGPGNATNVIGLEIFYNAYVYLKFGTAIAMAWMLGFLLIGLTMFQMKRISNMSFTAGDGK